MKNEHKHVLAAENGRFICQHCGAEEQLKLPCRMNFWAAVAEAFLGLHRDCKPRTVAK